MAPWCRSVLQEVLQEVLKYGRLKGFDVDQGRQFTFPDCAK